MSFINAPLLMLSFRRFSLSCFLGFSVLAQAQEKLDARSEKLFNNLGYGQYIERESQRPYENHNLKVLERLGTSYRKTGDAAGAAQVYASLLEMEPRNPDYQLYYAQALQGQAQYLQARTHYLKYHELKQAASDPNYQGQGLKWAKACERIYAFRSETPVLLQNQTEINGPKLDFSPSFYGNQLLFVSTRASRQTARTDAWLNDNFMDLYLAEMDREGNLLRVKNFDLKLNSRYHEGPSTFTSDLQRIYFTRNNYLQGKRGKSQERVTMLKIYTAQKVNGKWTNIQSLPFNGENFNTCHPTLSADGRVMVFARSSEKHQGAMDLYFSRLKGNFWTQPQRLPDNINTSGNELFPFLANDGTLFFASNGHVGLGGLDIFMCSIKNQDGPVWEWEDPINLGAPFNSESDDFGLILHRNRQFGYLSSNRQGGLGGDDIYKFEFEAGKDLNTALAAAPNLLNFIVYDPLTGQNLPQADLRITPLGPNGSPLSPNGTGVQLRLKPLKEGSSDYVLQVQPEGNNPNAGPNSGPTEQFTTDPQGRVVFPVKPKQPYRVRVEKPGYEPYDVELPPFDPEQEEFRIPLYPPGQGPKKQPDLAQQGSGPKQPLLDENGKPILDQQGQPVYTQYPNQIGDPQKALNQPSDRPLVSAYIYNKDYNRPLPNVAVKLINRCTGETIELSTGPNGVINYPTECGCDYIVRASKANFADLNEVIILSDTTQCKSLKPLRLAMQPGPELAQNDLNLGGNKLSGLKAGDVIELKNIFYDYDQHFIRSDAAEDLEGLLALMRAFPSMEIELSSHTDSRGTHEYNDGLSSRRAQAAKAYLTERGIAPQRIIARGYGERRLRNECSDGAPCSEYEHQRNRRTEVFILRFDQRDNIKVRYQDNTPRIVGPKRN